MSFLTGIRINNLEHDIKSLQSEIDALVVGNHPTIEGDLDMNNFNITELSTIVFNDNTSMSSAPPSNVLTNPITQNINMNSGYAIEASQYYELADAVMIDTKSQLLMMNNKLALVTSGANKQLFISTNETYGLTSNTDFMECDLYSCRSVQFSHDPVYENKVLQPDSTGENLTYDENVLISTSNLESNINGLGYYQIGDPLDMGGNAITGITGLSIGDDNALTCDSSNNLTYKSEIILTQTVADTLFYKLGENLDMQNQQINNVESIALNGHSLTIQDSNFMFDSSIIVTSENVSNYVSESSWDSVAGSSLNMSGHEINNCALYGIEGDKAFTAIEGIPSYGSSEIVVYPDNLIGSIQFNNDDINSAVLLHVSTPTIINHSNSITKSYVSSNPIFDFNIKIETADGYTIDPSTFYVEIIIMSSTQEDLGGWLRFNYNAFSFTDNVLSLICDTNALNANVIVLTALQTILSEMVSGNDTFSMYVYAFGQGINGVSTYLEDCNITCNLINPSTVQPNVLFYNTNDDTNSLTTIHNENIQLCQRWNNIPLPLSSSTVVYTIQLPNVYKMHMISVNIIGSDFCIKCVFCVYMDSTNSNAFPPYTPPFDAAIMESSISVQNIMGGVTTFDNVTFENNTSNNTFVDVIIHTNGSQSPFYPTFCSGVVDIVSADIWNQLNP